MEYTAVHVSSPHHICGDIFQDTTTPHGCLKPWMLLNPMCYSVLFLYIHSYEV